MIKEVIEIYTERAIIMGKNFIDQLYTVQKIFINSTEIEEQGGAKCPFSDLSRHALGRMIRYVNSCRWKNTEKTKVAVRNARRKATEVAAELGVSTHTVRSVRSQISSQLFGIFGSDVFDRILSGRGLPELITQLEVLQSGYTSVEKLLPPYIIEMLERVADDYSVDDVSYSMDECRDEIAFIWEHCIPRMSDKLRVVSNERLAYIYNLLLRGGCDKEKMELLHKVFLEYV